MPLKLPIKFIIFIIVCQVCFSNCNTANTNKSIGKLKNLKKENEIKPSDNEQVIQTDSLENESIQKPGSIENPNSYPIVGGWRLTKFHTDTIEILEDQTPHIVINLFAMQISGTDGCNKIGAPILKFNNDQIKIGNVRSTLIACIKMYDQNFLSNLALTTKYKIKETNLFFLNEDGHILLEFERADYNYFKNG